MKTKKQDGSKTGRNPTELQDAIAALGDQPGKAKVAAAQGKPADKPNPGRLNKDGETAVKQIDVARTKFETLQLAVVGEYESSLIVHNWSTKAIREMLGKHMGYKPADLQTDKDAFQDMLGSLYKDPSTGEMQIRTIMFKAAMLECIRLVPGVKYVDAMQAISVVGEFAPLYGQPMNRLDPVKVGPWNERVADLRFRAEYREWLAVLTFRYDPARITVQAIVNLLDKAGTTVGVGDWRPDKGGTSGMFKVLGGTANAEVAATMKRLRRWKISQLTPENTGTLALLESVGLDPESLKTLGRQPTSPGPDAANGTHKVEVRA